MITRSSLSRLTSTFSLLILLASPCIAQNKSDQIDQFLNAFYVQDLLNGVVLVGQADQILYEKAFGYASMEWAVENTIDGRFRIGSMTKQFTAALIMILEQEGKLELNDPISKHLPYYPNDSGNQVTIHHLLAHTSGIPEYNDAPNFWQDSTHNHYTLTEFVKKFGSGTPDFNPGTQYNYTNTEYLILGAIIEHLEGTSYEEVLEEKILAPLELNQTGIDHFEKLIDKRVTGYVKTSDGSYRREPYYYMGNLHGAGAMYSTVHDLFKWTRSLHHSHRILSDASRTSMMTPNLNDYGYGLTIRDIDLEDDRTTTLVGHGGGINGIYGQMVYYQQGEYFVLMINNTGNTRLADMRKGIRNILYDLPSDEYLPDDSH